MELRTSISIQNKEKVWIDVVGPTEADLKELGDEFEIHPAFIQDCLDPSHLPKYEKTEGCTFIIVRAYDEKCACYADTVQQLTRKFVIIVTAKAIVTIHRTDQPYLEEMRRNWGEKGAKRTEGYLINSLLRHMIVSYQSLVDQMILKVDEREEKVFRRGDGVSVIEDCYTFKRMVSISERMIRMTEDVILGLVHNAGHEAPYRRDLRDNISRVLFYLDDLQQRVDQLLHLHLALETQRTNEVMRVLTLFSVFFLPLTFIAGIYGMNFKSMPELNWEWGYGFSLAMMGVVALSLFLWFKKKGWMKN